MKLPLTLRTRQNVSPSKSNASAPVDHRVSLATPRAGLRPKLRPRVTPLPPTLGKGLTLIWTRMTMIKNIMFEAAFLKYLNEQAAER